MIRVPDHGIWGGPRRVYSAFQVFATRAALGADAMGGILPMYLRRGPPAWWFIPNTPSAGECRSGCGWPISHPSRSRCRCGRFITWRPTPHVEAPTAGTVILGGGAAEEGGYGFHPASRCRCCRMPAPFAPSCSPVIVAMSIPRCGAGAARHEKLIAYSRWPIGLFTMGIFTLNLAGASTARLQMLSHAIGRSPCSLCRRGLRPDAYRTSPATAAWRARCPDTPWYSPYSCWPRSACRHIGFRW